METQHFNLWDQEDQEGFRRHMAADDLDLEAVLARKIHTAKAGSVDPDDQTIDFVISDDKEDRDGGTISVSGWDVRNYMTNPVVLWAHNGSIPPIARAVDVRVQAGVLMSKDQFWDGPGPLGEFAQEIFDMYAMGFMSAVSVGFRPTTRPKIRRGPEDSDGYAPFLGLDFIGQELMEHSAVPIPSNPRALARAAGAGKMDKLFPMSWPHLEKLLIPTHNRDYDGPANAPSIDTLEKQTAEAKERRAEIPKSQDWSLASAALDKLTEEIR